MDSQTWRQIGRGALAGAVAGAALAAAGFRVNLSGTLEPLSVRSAGASSSFPEPPRDAPEPPRGHHEENRAMASQALAGAALGALFGFLRTRAGRPQDSAEAGLYETLLSTIGLGAWLAPLGLLGAESGGVADDQPDDWSYRQESLLDDAHRPYEDQPPYDPDRPYDAF